MTSKGFTLVEVLVVIAITAIVMVILTDVFYKSVRGGNKAELIALVKQNGQAALEAMDKTLRNSDDIVCPRVPTGQTTVSSDVVVGVKDGVFTRFSYGCNNQNQNGIIWQDSPTLQTNVAQESFLLDICSNPNYLGTMVGTTAVALTDIQNVSITSPSPSCQIFTRNKSFGFEDIVTINFLVAPGLSTPPSISRQVNTAAFTTSIELR